MVLSIWAASVLVAPLIACASIGVSIDSSYYGYYDDFFDGKTNIRSVGMYFY